LSHLTSLIQCMLNLYGSPSAVLIHCGGSDIGHTETPCGLLTYQIKVTFVSLFIEILPGCPIIWSSILPRIKWRQGVSVCPISLPLQCISTALRKPYKFNKPCISEVKWLHLILLIPTHAICTPYLSSPWFLPVGRFLVCSAASCVLKIGDYILPFKNIFCTKGIFKYQT
jgi:hypothetical protein